jgi:uncharacterized protein
MDITLAIIGGIFIVVGVIGSVIQLLPGPPLSYLGLLLLHFTGYAEFSAAFLIITGVVAAAASVVDNVLTAIGAKKFGGSDRAVWGATIGVIAGIFVFPPFGMILLAFAGAIIGELTLKKKLKEAFKASVGTLLGFILGTVIKVSVSGVYAYYYFYNLLK